MRSRTLVTIIIFDDCNSKQLPGGTLAQSPAPPPPALDRRRSPGSVSFIPYRGDWPRLLRACRPRRCDGGEGTGVLWERHHDPGNHRHQGGDLRAVDTPSRPHGGVGGGGALIASRRNSRCYSLCALRRADLPPLVVSFVNIGIALFAVVLLCNILPLFGGSTLESAATPALRFSLSLSQSGRSIVATGLGRCRSGCVWDWTGGSLGARRDDDDHWHSPLPPSGRVLDRSRPAPSFTGRRWWKQQCLSTVPTRRSMPARLRGPPPLGARRGLARGTVVSSVPNLQHRTDCRRRTSDPLDPQLPRNARTPHLAPSSTVYSSSTTCDAAPYYDCGGIARSHPLPDAVTLRIPPPPDGVGHCVGVLAPTPIRS